jgi:hypothetical protein
MSAMQSKDLADPLSDTLGVRISDIRAGWAAAREQAEWALDAWRASPGTAGYAVYRAAADRADAAQDELTDAARAAGSVQDGTLTP